MISDAHEGLKNAARKTFQGASWQRCRVHFARNVLARVPKGHQDVVAAALRTVFVHPNPAEISAAWDRTEDMFARQFPEVKELMDSAKTDVLAFTAFPQDHWRKIWSNNRSSESIKRSKRRTNLVQIFPNTDAISASSAPSSPSNTTSGPRAPVISEQPSPWIPVNRLAARALLFPEPAIATRGSPLLLLRGERGAGCGELRDGLVVGEEVDVDATDEVVAQFHVARGGAVVRRGLGPTGELSDEHVGDGRCFAFGDPSGARHRRARDIAYGEHTGEPCGKGGRIDGDPSVFGQCRVGDDFGCAVHRNPQEEFVGQRTTVREVCHVGLRVEVRDH